MAQSLPKTTRQWNVIGFDGFESLKLSEQPVPQLGDSQVLVKSRSSSSCTLPGSLPLHEVSTDHDLSPRRLSQRTLLCLVVP